jgi:cell division protein FtsL
MNAATRVSSQSIYIARKSSAQTWSLQSVAIISLLILVFVSAFAVVYVRDYQRQLITDLQGLQMEHDTMLTQRSQLLLEQAAWSTQTRVQQVAEQKLGMVFPGQQTMITVG